MKIILDFKTKDNVLPIEYRRSILSFIKECLKNYENGRFYDLFYSGTNIKDFNFAVILDKPKFKKPNILLESNTVKVLFSSGNNQTILILFNAFLSAKNKQFTLPNQNYLKLNKVVTKQDKQIETNQAVFRIVSPICVREHNATTNKDYYYSVANKDFIEKLKTNIKRQVPAYMKDYVAHATIIPVGGKKTVVQHYGQQIEVTLGKLAIEAHPILLNYINQYGIGSRKSAGFGYVEVDK